MGKARQWVVISLGVLSVLLAILTLNYLDHGGPAGPPVSRPEAPTTPAAPSPPKEAPATPPSPAVPPRPEPAKPQPEAPLVVTTNVPGASVSVWFSVTGEGKSPPSMEAKADERGRAEFALGFPRAILHTAAVTASAPGWTTVHAWSKGEDVELELETGFDVSGRVTFPDGRPARGVRLSWRFKSEAATDEAGRYVLGGLPEGKVTIESRDLGEDRTVSAGSTGVDFVMKRHVVQLRIRDEGGRFVPADHFDLRTTGEGAVWSSGGGTRDEPITACVSPGEKITAACRAEGYMNGVLETTLGKEPDFHEMAIVMKRPGPPGSLALTVKTDADPQPSLAIVTLLDRTGMAEAEYMRLKVGLIDGKGTLPGVAGGTFRACVSTGNPVNSEEYGLPEEKEVTVVPGKETPLDVVVRSGGRLTVVVKDAKGKVVPAEDLELVDIEGKEVDITFGNRVGDSMWFPPMKAEPAFGSFPVAPGRYAVRVVRYVKNEKTIAAEQGVDVVARKTIEVEIRLPE
jgi:hypothetical protein